MATKVIVSIPNEADYAVRIGQGILDDLGSKVAALGSFSQTLIITDTNVGPLYLAQAKASLARAGFKTSEITVPAGEETKSLEVAGEIWSAMAQLDLGRDCVVVALGGGVVGDLAGFVASTYMRGVCVVQVPTTLLSMVDSSVGGKTAVNLPEGKNLVGTFFQPSHVCADTATLSTLDQREWRCGCAEIAKSSVIDSDEFFFWMLENAPALAARWLAFRLRHALRRGRRANDARALLGALHVFPPADKALKPECGGRGRNNGLHGVFLHLSVDHGTRENHSGAAREC